VNRALDIYLNAERVGSLSQSSEQEMIFTYSPSATRPISIAMPIQKQTFGALHCEAFFGGLLPEGDVARRALGRRFGISANSSFSLLQNIGAECAGALSIISPDQSFAAEGFEEVQLLSPAELAQHIRELPQRPLFVGVNGIRLSLSGVQDKASVSVVDGVVASGMFSKERAVSAVGAMGILGNVAFAAGPACGVWLWQMGVHREQYIYASALNLTAALMVLTLPAQYDVKPKRKPKIRVFMRVSWLPAIAFIGCSTLQGGVNGALAVLTFQDRGIVNGALIFTASALTTVLFRYPAGRLVERFGARTLAVPTAILQSFGCILAAQAFSPLAVILAGSFLGMAWSAVVPVGIAILFENSSQSTRGTAMGSYNLAMAGGAALGALLAAIVTAIGMGYAQAEYFCAGAPFIALIYLFIAPRKKKRPAIALEPSAQSQ
jgi:HipA-like protein